MIELFNSFRDALYHVLTFFQELVEPLMGSQSYWFSIVMLTVAVRILLIPLTVKQVKSTRVMQELAPEIKKLQAKHKNDKTKLNEEMMALYKERGFNPMAGCWPLLAQMPFFFALYQVIYAQEIAGGPNVLIGKTFFGVPLQQHWLEPAGLGQDLLGGRPHDPGPDHDDVADHLHLPAPADEQADGAGEPAAADDHEDHAADVLRVRGQRAAGGHHLLGHHQLLERRPAVHAAPQRAGAGRRPTWRPRPPGPPPWSTTARAARASSAR